MAITMDDLIEQRTPLLDEWVAKQRRIAQLQAEAMDLLTRRTALWDEEVAMAPTHRDAIERSMIAEYAAAGHLSKGSVTYAFSDARRLGDFPALHASFAAGKVSAAHVREVIRESSPVVEAIASSTVEPNTLALYEAAVMEVAESDTSARTRAHARQVAAALAGLTVNERQKRARDERTVTVRSIGDGLAILQAILPEHLALAIQDRLTKMARHMRQHPEDRAVVLPDDITEEELFYLVRQSPDTITPAPDPDPDRSHRAQSAHDHADETENEVEAEAEAEAAIFAGGTFSTDPFSTDPFTDRDYEQLEKQLRDPRRFPHPDLDEEGFAREDFCTDPYDPTSPYYEIPDRPLSPDPQRYPGSWHIIDVSADSRTMDQLRADLLTDMLLTTTPSDVHGDGLESIHATIQITIPVGALLGDDDRPAELDGRGPLLPTDARTLGATARAGPACSPIPQDSSPRPTRTRPPSRCAATSAPATSAAASPAASAPSTIARSTTTTTTLRADARASTTSATSA